MIDTHCHLTFPDFAGQIDETLREAADAGVWGCISISTTSRDCLDALRVAQAHDNVWCTAGVHPLYSGKGPHDWQAVRNVAEDERCVAWGELGLDNHYDKPPRDTQRAVLAEQLAFIESCAHDGIDKPVVLHCREAFDDLIPLLRASSLDPARMVFHCFTGGPDDARAVLDLGAMISFTGVVTYRNAREVAEAARLVPGDRIMVETDSPFLSPEPVRGTRPCRPAFVVHTARFLAELRGSTFGDFDRQTDANAQRFFSIERPGVPGASA